jgi:hypothetical protein
MQIIGTFLLVVVSVAVVAGIYLNVTARAATLGRQIQEMQVRMGGHIKLDKVEEPLLPDETPEPELIPIEELNIQIVDLEGKLAEAYSISTMHERAARLGFEGVDPERIAYMEVAGYAGRTEATLAPPPEPVVVNSPLVPAAYKQSLLDWLKSEVDKTKDLLPDLLLGGVQK